MTTNLGMWYHGLGGLPDLNFNLLNGYLVFGNAANAFGKDGMQDPAILTAFGGVVHYGQGVCFALIYSRSGIHPLLPIPNTFSATSPRRSSGVSSSGRLAPCGGSTSSRTSPARV